MIRRVSKGGLTHLLFFLSSNISLQFYAKFEGQRFIETGDVSRPGTNSISLGGSPRVAYRICFSFYRQMSVRNFMQNLRVSFSCSWRCLKTWDQFHIIRKVSKGGLTHLLFLLSTNISLEFYANLRDNVFSKLTMPQDLGPIPCH